MTRRLLGLLIGVVLAGGCASQAVVTTSPAIAGATPSPAPTAPPTATPSPSPSQVPTPTPTPAGTTATPPATPAPLAKKATRLLTIRDSGDRDFTVKTGAYLNVDAKVTWRSSSGKCDFVLVDRDSSDFVVDRIGRSAPSRGRSPSRGPPATSSSGLPTERGSTSSVSRWPTARTRPTTTESSPSRGAATPSPSSGRTPYERASRAIAPDTVPTLTRPSR